MEQEEKKEPERGWIGNWEKGRHFDVVESGGRKYLKMGGQWHEIKGGRWAEEIEGIGKVERLGGKIYKIGEHRVDGDIGIE